MAKALKIQNLQHLEIRRLMIRILLKVQRKYSRFENRRETAKRTRDARSIQYNDRQKSEKLEKGKQPLYLLKRN